MYDIVFISYDEPNAEHNWKKLSMQSPRQPLRLHGIKGIHAAHKIAASMVTTSMFYVVDGDAVIMPDFKFNHVVDPSCTKNVHVFRAHNPVNDLVYGYGAVKLLPTAVVLDMDDNKKSTDMTSSLPHNGYTVVNRISNTTAFNTDQFSAWRSAFRECAKLSSKVIVKQKDHETESRLETWCTKGQGRPYGYWTLIGAKAGREFGKNHANDLDQLSKINDWAWLRATYEMGS
jgi:hypothetical protein